MTFNSFFLLIGDLNRFFSIRRLECLEDINSWQQCDAALVVQGREERLCIRVTSDILDWQEPGLIPWSWIGTTTYDEGWELLKNLRGHVRWLLFPIIKVDMKTSSLSSRFLFLFWDPEIWELCGPIIIVHLTYLHNLVVYSRCCQSLANKLNTLKMRSK